jgi:hypothetical protein
MNMIAHPAVGMYSATVSLCGLGRYFLEVPAIRSAEEDVLPIVPAKDRVIETTRQVNAAFSRHPCPP